MKLRNRKILESVNEEKENIEKMSKKILKNKPDKKKIVLKKSSENSSKLAKTQFKTIFNENAEKSVEIPIEIDIKEENQPTTSGFNDIQKIEFNKPPERETNLSTDSESDFEEVSSVAISNNNLPKCLIKKSPTKIELIDPIKEQDKMTNIENMLRLEAFNNFKITKRGADEMMPVNDDSSLSSEEEFEEVEMERELDMAELKKTEHIEINISDGKSKKKEIDVAARMERMIKALNKKFGIEIVKSHLVCWLAHGFYLNQICLSDLVRATGLSMLDHFDLKNFQLINFNQCILDKFLKNIRQKSCLKNLNPARSVLVTPESLCESISCLKFCSYLHFILVVLVLMRSLNIKARICVCFDVYELNELTCKEKSQPVVTKISSSKSNKRRSDTKIEGVKKKEKKSTPKLKETLDDKSLASKLSKLKDDECESEESDLEAKTSKRKSNRKRPVKNRQSYSSDDEQKELKKDSKSEKSLVNKRLNSKVISIDETEKRRSATSDQRESCFRNYWLEVYLEEEKKWIPVEPIENKQYSGHENYFEERFGKQILYVCAFDGDNRVKEVTKRYASKWTTSTRVLRIDFIEKKLWWKKTLMRHETLDASLDEEEEEQLKKLLLDQGLPASVSEFKDHPLYVLKRHLLKFQDIYPNDAKPVGYLRNEAIYSRDNLHTLHSRQTWLKYARTVKPYEKPYKIVKGRIKMSDFKNGCRENPELDIYGWWQTKPYDPPIAENGRIPLNEFGNVELFQPCMLPIGTIHLKNMPNLNRICRKINIECAAAVTGFDAHGGFSHAVVDGWVVCKEYKDTVIAAFEAEEVKNNLKMIEKQQERVWGNWRHLIKSILIREKLKKKYGN